MTTLTAYSPHKYKDQYFLCGSTTFTDPQNAPPPAPPQAKSPDASVVMMKGKKAKWQYQIKGSNKDYCKALVYEFATRKLYMLLETDSRNLKGTSVDNIYDSVIMVIKDNT